MLSHSHEMFHDNRRSLFSFSATLAILLISFSICFAQGTMVNSTSMLAVQKNAASPVAHYYLGLALMKEEKFDAAQAEFETAIKNGGEKLALAHKYLGGVYWRNHDYKQAADELEKYITLEPKAPDAKKIRETIKEFRHKS